MRRFVLGLLSFALASSAQEFKAGTVQVYGFVAPQWTEDIGTKPAFGAGARVGFTPHISGFGEWGYSPLADVFGVILGTPLRVNANIHDFTGGLQFHTAGGRIVPYGLLGFGGIRVSARVRAAASLIGAGVQEGDSILVGTFGGGFRTYMNRRVGLSVEAKALRGRDTSWIGRVAFGVFVQF